MRKVTVLLAFLALMTLSASGARAASNRGGGKGHNAADPTGPSIRLNQDPAALHLGSQVNFTTVLTGLSSNEYGQIDLECSQSGAFAYGELQMPNSTFTLGGGSSKWLTTGGGADCVAILYAYGSKGGMETIRELDRDSFPVG